MLLWNETTQRHQVFVHRVSRNPTGIAVGDFNADGFTDIVTVEAEERVLSVLAGDGNGNFERTVQEVLVIDETVDQANAIGFFGINRSAGEDQICRPGITDNSRQEKAHAGVR